MKKIFIEPDSRGDGRGVEVEGVAETSTGSPP
jgi:hypothetical protein